jgi:hypothetical protein
MVTNDENALMLAEVNQEHEPEFQVSANDVRSLIADLATREHYDMALQVAHVASEVFGLMPATVEQFCMDIELVERLQLRPKSWRPFAETSLRSHRSSLRRRSSSSGRSNALQGL